MFSKITYLYYCCNACDLQKGVASDLAAREKERVSLYRQKTKAALVIQLAWRRYVRRKRHRLAAEAEAKALQVSMCPVMTSCPGDFQLPTSK